MSFTSCADALLVTLILLFPAAAGAQEPGTGEFLHVLFNGRRAAALAIDINTGKEILSCDPENFLDTEFPFGSLAKIFMTAAGLEDGTLDPDAKVFCRKTSPDADELESCWRHTGHGSLNLVEAIAHSCNIYFIESADYVNYDSFARLLKKLGLTDNPPQVASDHNISIKRMVGLSTELKTTPRKMLYGAAAFFNGGRLFTAGAADLSPPVTPNSYNIIDLSSKISAILKAGMWSGAEFGTSVKASEAAGTSDIMGKTGTAKYIFGGKRDSTKTHAWWIGFQPATTPPEIGVVVFMLEGSGAGDAAPAGGVILKHISSSKAGKFPGRAK